MPLRFPGMDPYLERPDIFPDFHDSFITYLREALQSALPETYYAGIGRRTWIEFATRTIGPDVELLQNAAARKYSPGTAAVLERSPTGPVEVHVPHDERVEPLLEIYASKGSDRRLVTAIEVLSPTNKERESYGRNLYLKKQQEIIEHSQVNLVEIDLLRAGEHSTAIPKAALTAAVGWPEYHICIHRFDDPERYFIHPVALEMPLPEIDIPLLPGDGSSRVDLQAVFERTYNTGPYRREIDYESESPSPPLTEEQSNRLRGRMKANQPDSRS